MKDVRGPQAAACNHLFRDGIALSPEILRITGGSGHSTDGSARLPCIENVAPADEAPPKVTCRM
jgi:hypothetical protein